MIKLCNEREETVGLCRLLFALRYALKNTFPSLSLVKQWCYQMWSVDVIEINTNKRDTIIYVKRIARTTNDEAFAIFEYNPQYISYIFSGDVYVHVAMSVSNMIRYMSYAIN